MTPPTTPRNKGAGGAKKGAGGAGAGGAPSNNGSVLVIIEVRSFLLEAANMRHRHPTRSLVDVRPPRPIPRR